MSFSASDPKPEEHLRKCFEEAIKRGSMNQAAQHLGVEGTTFRRNIRRFLKRHATVDDWRQWDRFKETIPNLVRLNLDEGIPRPDSPVEPEDEIEIGGQIEHDEGDIVIRRATLGTRRYICTVAQNNTHLHAELWENIKSLADFYGADLLVARNTYDVENYKDRKRKQLAGMDGRHADEGLWYPNEISPYVIEDGRRIKLANDLVFVAENIRPTMLDPLSALETYTGQASMILPHGQVAMRSVATQKHEPAKFMYTTGTVSQRNYLPGKAGGKASFHHGYGALLVEVDENTGQWWCRQISAGDNGSFYDLDVFVEDGKVYQGVQPEAIVWGDIHVEDLEEDIQESIWGYGGMVDQLRPKLQVFHDLLSFNARSHHEIKDPFAMFKRWVEGKDSVENELKAGASFLRNAHRPDSLSVVVNSNHDRHLERWLKEADWRKDPCNASIFMKAVAAKLEAIQSGDTDFLMLEWAMKQNGAPDAVRFLHEDESYIICPHAAGGVELGLHGDRGANGARGTPAGLKKLPTKLTIGDKHSAGIFQGLHVVGVTGNLDMEFNKGLSSWSRSHGIVHPNGKRQIITMRGTRWKAE